MAPWATASTTDVSRTTNSSYAYPPNTAYTPVPTRTGFGQYISSAPQSYAAAASVAPASSSAPEPTKQKTEWPASVRDYVQRSFLPVNDDPSVSRTEIEAKLKSIIGTAKEQGALYTIDWTAMPLPQALVRTDREALLRRDAAQGSPYGSKKRKSGDFDHAPPPWASTNSRASFADRVSYPTAGNESLTSSKFQKEETPNSKRARRFQNEQKAYEATARTSVTPPPSSGPVVGTNEKLEKKYLRLTAPPVPSNVRPERVLRLTLELLKKKWRADSNYSYICDQFKSVRQDMTVQRIQNDFTVSVYEIHARIALEKGDIGEYNQCQTQLRFLYAKGLKGNPMEFKAYRILYFIHTANRTGMNDTLADLTTAEKKDPAVRHALDVRSALALGNYHKFFQLYLETPNMGAYLMDMFVVRERLAALCNLCKAYKQDVKLRFITEELGFESDADAAQFIIDYQGQHLLEDRQDYIAFLTAKAGNLFEGARAQAFNTVDIKGQI